MNLKNKKILLTGGNGFIGNNLNKKLIKLGAKTEIFDIKFGNDICNRGTLEQFIKRKYDVIYHLAAFSGSAKSNHEIKKSFDVNTLATLDLCDMTTKFSPNAKLIISSSRLEYGSPLYLPVDENHPTIPTSAYGLSKLAATQIAQLYFLKDKLKVITFRTSNVYGPHSKGMHSDYNIINRFIDQAKANKVLEIFGNGNQLRDYIYVDDLVDAFILAINSKKVGQVYNLGFGKGIKFKDMVKLIIKIVGKGKLKFVKWPSDFEKVETGSYVTNLSKIKNETGFSPKVDFEEGIKRSV